ncbi:MAG: metal ABC transporter solute-binding protein, Zn/Mn family [Chlamydiales bacterium]
MRKVIPLLLILFLIGCLPRAKVAEEANWRQDNGRIKVLCTIAMIDDLVSQIGGEYVDSIPLIRGELDPHSYELVKGDGEKFYRADAIFYNGLGLEHSLSLRQNLENNPKAVAVGDVILQEGSLVLLVDGQYDPHIWTDMSLWARTLDPIVATLSHIDPQHATYYELQGEVLREKIMMADRAGYELVQQIPDDKRYIVTSHDAFNYFARRYLKTPEESDWKSRFKAPEGLAPEAQLSVRDILEMIQHIQRYQINVLFPESNVSKDSLKKIKAATSQKGCPVHLCEEPLYGDAMGEGQNYIEMMEHNFAVIARELMR